MASCPCRQGRDGDRSRGATGAACRLQWTGGRCRRFRWFRRQPCGARQAGAHSLWAMSLPGPEAGMAPQAETRNGRLEMQAFASSRRRMCRQAPLRWPVGVRSVAHGWLLASPQVWQYAEQSSLRPRGVGCGHPQQSRSSRCVRASPQSSTSAFVNEACAWAHGHTASQTNANADRQPRTTECSHTHQQNHTHQRPELRSLGLPAAAAGHACA
jgi:hypothetical protein